LVSGKIKEELGLCFYIYRIGLPDKSFSGLWASTQVDDLTNGTILKHEKIHTERSLWVEEMFKEKRIDFNPILITYFPEPEIDQWILDVQSSKPIISIKEEKENALHEIWRVSDPNLVNWVQTRFKTINPVYLADGHHRAQAFQNWIETEFPSNEILNSKIPGFSSIYFSLNEVEIKAYHRVFSLFDPGQLDRVMDKIRDFFILEKTDRMEIPNQKGDFFMINFRKEMYFMKPKKDFKMKFMGLDSTSRVSEIKSHLDVSIFQDLVLSECLNMGTNQALGELNYMGGRHSEDSIKEKVFMGEYSFGFLLAPPEFDEIKAISEAGLFMPQKSTYFEPKIPSGLIIQKLDKE